MDRSESSVTGNDPLNPTVDEAAAIVADLVQDFRANERYFLEGEKVSGTNGTS